jgi:glycerate 2-kinase
MKIVIIKPSIVPSHENQIKQILLSALSAVEPRKIVHEALSFQDDAIMRESNFQSLILSGRCILIGAGKASFPMAEGAFDVLGERINFGTIITKIPPKKVRPEFLKKIQVLLGDHPIPGMNSVEATRQVLASCDNLKSIDSVLFLISGGASALMTSPQPGIQLAEIQQMTQILLDCGAEISEINILRKHLDIIKGGGLARLLFPAKIISLAISDVIGDDPSVIGSGPTASDTSTFQNAMQIIEKYNLQKVIPLSITNTIQEGIRGSVADTIKPDNPILTNCSYRVVGSNERAVNAAMSKAMSLGFRVINLGFSIQGEARIVGGNLVTRLFAFDKEKSVGNEPVCMIGGGETTVTRTGNGRGGRNLETALGAVEEISEIDRACLVTLATDGEDGTTGAAGAVITSETYKKGMKLGLHPRNFLGENNSLAYFERVGGLIRTGSTGTNVMDMYFLFRF